MNLTIDRGQWLTGTAYKLVGRSGLCETKKNLMCCLGFLGCALGYVQSTMRGATTLSEFETRKGVLQPSSWLGKPLDGPDRRRFNKKASLVVEHVEDALTTVNDKTKGIHPARREAAIQYLFQKYGGINVRFIGKYADATKLAHEAVG